MEKGLTTELWIDPRACQNLLDANLHKTLLVSLSLFACYGVLILSRFLVFNRPAISDILLHVLKILDGCGT